MGDTERFTIVVDEGGRLVLPAQLRRRLDLHPGDRLIATLDEDGGIRLVSVRELVERMRGFYQDLAPDRSLVDELIAERREEAQREEMT